MRTAALVVAGLVAASGCAHARRGPDFESRVAAAREARTAAFAAAAKTLVVRGLSPQNPRKPASCDLGGALDARLAAPEAFAAYQQEVGPKVSRCFSSTEAVYLTRESFDDLDRQLAAFFRDAARGQLCRVDADCAVATYPDPAARRWSAVALSGLADPLLFYFSRFRPGLRGQLQAIRSGQLATIAYQKPGGHPEAYAYAADPARFAESEKAHGLWLTAGLDPRELRAACRGQQCVLADATPR